jgi:hypothetical protein
LLPGGHQETGENPPPPAFDEASGEVSGQFVEGTTAGDHGPRAAGETEADDDPEPSERGPHTANVGPTPGDTAASWDDEVDDEPEE